MAGFGSISLAQTVIGTLIDQRAVVLYKQPSAEIAPVSKYGIVNTLSHELYGNAIQYEELFAGMASLLGSDILTKLANISSANPYGITYMSAKVSVESDLCDHPIETGRTLTDSSIIQPITAQVEVAMPTFFAERIYNSMYDLQQKKENKIILQTKYGVYKNLVLQGFGYSLEHKTADRTIFTLTLREIMEVEPYGEFGFLASSASGISNPSDLDTISNGTQVAGA